MKWNHYILLNDKSKLKTKYKKELFLTYFETYNYILKHIKISANSTEVQFLYKLWVVLKRFIASQSKMPTGMHARRVAFKTMLWIICHSSNSCGISIHINILFPCITSKILLKCTRYLKRNVESFTISKK